MRQYLEVDFSEEIIYAACHNLAYDTQCEFDRGPYIYELINLAPQKSRIMKAVLSTLVAQKEDRDALYQMCDISSMAARDGDEKARAALYARFDKNLKKGWKYCGDSAIIELDGVDGFLRMLDLRGRILLADPDDWEDSRLVDRYQEENPAMDVPALLKSAARKNSNVAFYVKMVTANKREPRKERIPYTYESVKQRIEGNRWYSAPLALKDLPVADLEMLARDFLTTTRPNQQLMYLWLFINHKFPFGHKAILQLLEKGAKGRLRSTAIQALSPFKHRAARRLFTENINGKDAYLYVLLLCENYKRGDQSLLTDLIQRTKNKDEIHSIAADMVDVFTRNPTADCLLPIEAVYEKLNCSFHREYLLDILLQCDVLPDRIREEMAFDSNIDIRDMVR
jgi:hypothetical protein